MNIDGTNTLACTRRSTDCRDGEVPIYPLPHMPVVKDLVPDLTHFYAQYASIKHWLRTQSPTPSDRERCSRRRIARSSTACTRHPLRLLQHQLPSYWWNGDRYLGPAILLQAYRWIVDSRDEDTGARASTISRTRSSSIAATDHELRAHLPEGPEPGARDR